MKMKNLLFILFGALLAAAGIYLSLDFLKSFLPFVIGMMLVVMGMVFILRGWK